MVQNQGPFKYNFTYLRLRLRKSEPRPNFLGSLQKKCYYLEGGNSPRIRIDRLQSVWTCFLEWDHRIDSFISQISEGDPRTGSFIYIFQLS